MAEKKEKSPEGGSKKKLFIIIGAVVFLLLVGGGVGGWYFLKPEPPPPEEVDPGLKVPVPDLQQQTEIGPMVNIEEFVVNIISGDTPHYVKASLTVELSNEAVKPEVEQRMPQVRDAVLLLIGNKTYEELQDLQGKRQLKAELTSKINSFLQTGKVRAIYFTNFVVQ
ncbi:flagellar basal body-associated protein FliL [Desulforhopalus sp. IMCC35007]|uniref:flagellar basal body-associated FliL family protein n=1 Tax=Desulforhopalus sp. IMCC35007 TaxID=2569543 RepID=UPI0010AED140|nr:flagellar basal body-associated FliL family protein [Desulforhopalus sp. IMCC35007]TKB10285.1 flagellar basal body-associated FliL family protein [Desulforhopalus sp. IMCC35007]